MSTQYYAPEQHGPDQHGPDQQGPGQQPTWQPSGWQQAPGQYPARRPAPWGAIMAAGAAVIVACTLALVFLLGHLATPAPGGGTSATTSGSEHHAPVNPAVPTHPAANPAVPAHPAG